VGLPLEQPRPVTVLAPGVGGESVRMARETGVGGVGLERPELALTCVVRVSTSLLGDNRCGEDARAALVERIEPVLVAPTRARIPGIPGVGRRCRFGVLPFRFSTRSLPRRGFPGMLLRLCLPHL